ncbi:MAG: hypothetical protein OEU54_07410 [Gemmatimonadota bacterium]|nr:hypothetical protein [Gemmatimonadota bacterium]
MTPSTARSANFIHRLAPLALVAGAVVFSACASASGGMPMTPTQQAPMAYDASPGDPDPRIGLGAGLFDAEEAIWNLEWVSQSPPPPSFVGSTNSDLAFLGDYAMQGNYDGVMIWDISDPANPTLTTEYVCPASQSDVSVYGNLMFVSGEGTSGRLDCGDQGVQEAVSHHRLRGIRIFDISDVRSPEYIANVQTCRGSHTHTVLKSPSDDENVYIYVSGSSSVRPEEELEGCVAAGDDPASALFRIEVIRVPLDSPEDAAIVSSPRIFQDLVAPETHGASPADERMMEEAVARGEFVATIQGQSMVLPPQFIQPQLQRVMRERGGTGTPTAADSAKLREEIPGIIEAMVSQQGGGEDEDPDAPRPGPTQCHDITVYPEIGLAGGACGGYGLLLDIRDPENPVRIDAVADSNFSYWHSATFNNDGTKILFTDEWGGGGAPKCRIDDPYEWGADAIFTLEEGRMVFHEYFKMDAPQTSIENCVAHNGSLIPIPGRDVMVQGWYQGGINVFDWTDPDNPIEIAFHDRGPSDADSQGPGGSWSVYWYNGVLVNSEISRGLDIFRLIPSYYLTQNEIDASNTVRLDYLNAQGQPQYVFPPSFALARAYVDQLERSGGLSAGRIAEVRAALADADGGSRNGLSGLANELDREAGSSSDSAKVRTLAGAVRDLSS